MPGISSAAPRYDNWEMDHYQHYFYDDRDPDEDFFMSTAPSEDIWKKFELPEEGSGKVGLLCPSLGDKLEWVSQFLGQEDEHNQQHAQELPYKLAGSGDSSIIIQDCMWSCFSAGQQLERVLGERPRLGAGGSVLSPWKTQSALADTWLAGGLPADCVDPAAVLTFPLPGGCKRPISSGSESHTDSSDNEDGNDEDEEEIDVVTVDHQQQQQQQHHHQQQQQHHQQHQHHHHHHQQQQQQHHHHQQQQQQHHHHQQQQHHHQQQQHHHHHQQQQQRKPRRLVASRKPVTITVRADPHDPSTKRFHISIHQQQHNYAAPSPDTLPAAPEPARKKVRQKVSSAATQPPQNSLHNHPRLVYAPLNPDSRKSHLAVARSESPNLSAASPTSFSSPSSPSSSSSSSHRSSRSKPASRQSSPLSSDCEDTDKRRAHNFLERKRRNDLRSRFLLLRDEIPELADCAKTPKVAILTRATEYLQQLQATERQKSQERKQLKARQLQLLQRLAQFKRS